MLLMQEIEEVPDTLLEESIDFLKFLKRNPLQDKRAWDRCGRRVVPEKGVALAAGGCGLAGCVKGDLVVTFFQELIQGFIEILER